MPKSPVVWFSRSNFRLPTSVILLFLAMPSLIGLDASCQSSSDRMNAGSFEIPELLHTPSGASNTRNILSPPNSNMYIDYSSPSGSNIFSGLQSNVSPLAGVPYMSTLPTLSTLPDNFYNSGMWNFNHSGISNFARLGQSSMSGFTPGWNAGPANFLWRGLSNFSPFGSFMGSSLGAINPHEFVFQAGPSPSAGNYYQSSSMSSSTDSSAAGSYYAGQRQSINLPVRPITNEPSYWGGSGANPYGKDLNKTPW